MIGSIDIMDGQAVQLVGGERLAVNAGDPRPFADSFGLIGEVAVVDLDAALGRGNNASVVRQLLQRARCRVGGGIRDVATAIEWLDAGASKVVLGTAATPDILTRLPKDRVIAALDAKHDRIVVDGWQRETGQCVAQRMRELRDCVGGFLVTFVEREGRLQGIDLDRIAELVRAAEGVPLTVAGGVTTPEEVAAIDRLGAQAQVGMALYTQRFDMADALSAMLNSDRADGIWPTVVVDESGRALGLAFSNCASLRAALSRRRGIYQSRRRGLWVKGETSGAVQDLLRIDLDCDRDTLRFTVRQRGNGFCHRGTPTCWGVSSGLAALLETLESRVRQPDSGSYTSKLFNDFNLRESKLIEEATELANAKTKAHVIHEAADVFYFALVAAVRAGVSIADVAQELDRRALTVTRRSVCAEPRKGAVQ